MLDDGREVVGKLLVYDQHMNVVLSETTESRPQTKKMIEQNVKATRELGLILLRGEHIVSVTVLQDTDAARGVKRANFDAAAKSKKASVKHVRLEVENEQ